MNAVSRFLHPEYMLRTDSLNVRTAGMQTTGNYADSVAYQRDCSMPSCSSMSFRPREKSRPHLLVVFTKNNRHDMSAELFP